MKNINQFLHKFILSSYVLFSLVAIVIIIDFAAPGRIIEDEIIKVESERQQYYNAARNYHFSYKIITTQYEFSVAEDFANSVRKHDKIEYSVSGIFKEVNWYRVLLSNNKSVYPLRLISGLILPLLTLIAIFVDYRNRQNIGTFTFILLILLTVDMIILMI